MRSTGRSMKSSTRAPPPAWAGGVVGWNHQEAKVPPGSVLPEPDDVVPLDVCVDQDCRV